MRQRTSTRVHVRSVNEALGLPQQTCLRERVEAGIAISRRLQWYSQAAYLKLQARNSKLQ